MARSPEILLQLFVKKTVVDLPTIQEALGGVSPMTAFRCLKQVPYRRSYDHNGRYYSRHDPSRYDGLGLWSFGGVHFSNDGSLKDTVRRLVRESAAGATHRELSDKLRVRVHNALLNLVQGREVTREQVEAVYVYLHPEASVREEQIARRREDMKARESGDGEATAFPDDAVVIQVLLTLLRHPGSQPAEITRRLRGHAPPITSDQVQDVFTRFDLGEKGGS